MDRLEAQIRAMKAELAQYRKENRQTRERVRVVETRAPAAAGIVPPANAIPAFVTADKKLLLGGITITPGGFLAAESVFRSRTTQSDINTGYGNIPFNNSPLAHTNEYRFTARQSRLALLAEGRITPAVTASGYAEFDFLGAGTTSNATDTNSYAPRIRQLYAALDFENYGMHALAGQTWSLLTLNSKGITPRNELPPPTIDGQFIPGFTFARQATVRLTKDIDKRWWFAIAAEEAQTTFGGAASCTGSPLTGSTGAAATPGAASPPGVNVICGATGSGAGFSQYGQTYSLNHAPDVIAKVAYEGRLGEHDLHLEADAVYRDLYDRTNPLSGGVIVPGAGSNHDSTGWGVGGGVAVALIPHRLDFQGNVLAGRGIGRYGAGLLPDATFNANGSLHPIGEVQGMGGFTYHATPALDLYAFGGIEREQPAYFQTGTAADGSATYFGYGSPTAVNTGCGIENGTCAGNTQSLWQVTGGFWDKLYKGSFGEVRAGIQYSFTQRQLFQSQTAGVTYQPKADEHMVFTSLRYYPFQ